jgi:ferredoxin--NADP+ reductase
MRVAIVGSGPAGFYAADYLLKAKDIVFDVDMFDRLPAPFGLVRFGVAPDHQRIKLAAKAFERTASSDRYRFFGNVALGRDLAVGELREHYDQVLLAVGSATDKRLAIPGEDLSGSHAATAFVGWYNGHPDFREEVFDLDCERAVVVGVGNVAMDVTRVLIRNPDELAPTDIAGYALDALRRSRVREIVLLGRRGPAQAAFDEGELADIVELAGVDVAVEPEPVRAAREDLASLDSAAKKNVSYLQKLIDRPGTGAERRVRLRFLASPVELVGHAGRVRGVRVEKNQLARRADGSVVARGTGEYEVIEAGLVMRSIGYHGIPLEGVPFDERNGIIPNVDGRVSDAGGAVQAGMYVVGWIKRGPTGLIGTNKSDAKQTVDQMLEDARRTRGDAASVRDRDAAERLLRERAVRAVTYPQWRVVDALEVAQGTRLGKVREKFYSVEAMLAALEAAARGS